MNRLTSTLLALALALGPGAGFAAADPRAITPESVVVLYNSAEDESETLAQHYAKAREIPKENVVGLPLPTTDEISRVDFDAKLRDPLRKIFDQSGWWKRAKGASGLVQPVSNKVRFLVTMRGVPFKVARTPASIPEQKGKKRRHYPPSVEGDEASVDSELSLLGVEGYSIKGHLNNPYFGKDDSVMSLESTSFLVVGRLDGPSFALCTRLIDDAVAIEQEGLWGMAYLDLARKGAGYEAGDNWIENIARMNKRAGIPSVIDRHRDTFVTNYPMREAAIYFGWYAHNRNGPLLNPGFNFRRGAVAVHLHSFSAYELRHPQKRWSGPLLNRGAAATVGNVYEPFLQLTHHFDILYQRLLQGYTIGEAAAMSIPALSWQGVLLGDPLYRPFSSEVATDPKAGENREFMTLRKGFHQWKDDPETLVTKLRTAANKLHSGFLFEALGLLARENGEEEQAAAFFKSARDMFLNDVDKLRQDLHQVDLHRTTGDKNSAILLLRKIEPRYAKLPEGKSITALLNIINPPAPPPVKVEPKKK
ncbi:MAG: TIGR03790 family protein [Roseibacillus sp.]